MVDSLTMFLLFLANFLFVKRAIKKYILVKVKNAIDVMTGSIKNKPLKITVSSTEDVIIVIDG